MSTNLHELVWELRSPLRNDEILTSIQKSVLARFAYYANEHGFSKPTYSLIAEELCVTRKTVQRAVTHLAELGMIDTVSAEYDTRPGIEGGRGGKLRTQFRISQKKIEELLPHVVSSEGECK